MDERLDRFPAFGFFALSIAAAALGNARGAIEDLMELAGGKTAWDNRALAERPATQAAVARSEADLRAARAFFYEAIEQAWEAAQEDAPVAGAQRLGLRLAATHAVRSSAQVARSMYDLGGGTAIYEIAPPATVPRCQHGDGPLPRSARRRGSSPVACSSGCPPSTAQL